MISFSNFVDLHEQAPPPMPPAGGAPPMGAPPMAPPMPPMGGAPPMGMGAPPMGGPPGAPGAPGGSQPLTQLKVTSVWDVMEKLLDGEPLGDEKQADKAGQDQSNMVTSAQPQPPPAQALPGMAPSGQATPPGQLPLLGTPAF